MKIDHLVVFCTCPADTARDLTEMLLTRRLAACVNCLPGIESSYWWQGDIPHDQETLLVIKTRSDRFSEIQDAISEIHPYDVPEIIALPIVEGSDDYLRWIDACLGFEQGSVEPESATNNDE